MWDSDVRAATLNMLHEMHGGDAETRIVEEMGVWSGSVRIDIAVINGELSGFELKSDRDTLQRLPQQADIYSRVFDRMTLVVGARHTKRAREAVPKWWSITEATAVGEGVHLRIVRRGRKNPHPDPFLIAQLLWREEAIGLLDTLGLARGWRSKTAAKVHEHLALSLPISELAAEVRAVLKRRPGWLGQPVDNMRNVAVER